MSAFALTIEIPEGIEDAQGLAGRLAHAAGNVLLGVKIAIDVSDQAVAHDDAVVAVVSTPAAEPVENMYLGPDGPTKLRELLCEVAPNTRLALRAMGEESLASGGIRALALRERLGAGSASVLAGYLTSLGFAEKRTGLYKPYSQRWGQVDGVWGNYYSMEPEVARSILELTNEDGSVA